MSAQSFTEGDIVFFDGKTMRIESVIPPSGTIKDTLVYLVEVSENFAAHRICGVADLKLAA